MRLSSKAYEHLVCPDCRTRLVETEQGIWGCTNGHNFPEINGVLVLRSDLDSHPVSPQGGDGSIEIEKLLTLDGILGVLKKIIGTNYVPYGFNPQELIQPDDLVLNLGSGMAAGNSPSMVNLDYFLFPCIDVVADAHNIPFEDSSFDVVLSEFMLEHVQDPFRICAEMSGVLKPGGTLYVSCPFIHPYHAFPSDYFRFTHQG
jgi:SAM-dependent methyltransferase